MYYVQAGVDLIFLVGGGRERGRGQVTNFKVILNNYRSSTRVLYILSKIKTKFVSNFLKGSMGPFKSARDIH